MKIIIAAGIYLPDIGGPATYSELIAREFSKRGIKIGVICYSDEKSSKFEVRRQTNLEHRTYNIEQFPVVRILRKYWKPVRYWLYFWNLLKIAKNCDVIYAQGPLGAGLPAMLVSKILSKRFVIKIVGDYAWEQYQNKISNLKSQISNFEDIEVFQKNRYDFLTELRRKIQKMVVKSADKVIVPSEFLKKIVKGWGINSKKIKVIYNAISRSRYTQIKTQKGAEDIIISAGRPQSWKGFDTLRDIMPDLLKQNPKFKLIIASKLPHSELMAKFKASKIFVLNTGYEGLPHIVLEAMACGLPVITTNICGNLEVVKDNYNGLLIEYNNKKQLKEAILKLWRDKKMQKKFIENGYKTLEKFKLETMVDKTLAVLKP